MRWLLATLLIAPGRAVAQSCPSNAETGPSVPAGTKVTILDIHRDDAYFTDRSRYIGQTGQAESELYPNGGCWFGGSVRLDDGTSLYFYKAAVDAGGASGTWPDCPPNAIVDDIPRGRSLAVIAIHPDDAYANSPTLSIGDVVTAGEPLSNNGGCWFAGSILTQDGTSLYAYKIAFGKDQDACPAGALTHAPIGQPLTVAAIHPELRSAMRDVVRPGDTLLLDGVDDVHGDCWFSGPATRPSGEALYIARAAFVRGTGASASCPTDHATAITRGDRVRVAAVHVDDPYAGVASRVVGLTGRVDRSPQARPGCWYGVDLVTDAGIRYRFDRVAVTPD